MALGLGRHSASSTISSTVVYHFFRHFSRGARFRPASHIEALQMYLGGRNWAAGRSPLVPTADASVAIDGSLQGWGSVIDLRTAIT